MKEKGMTGAVLAGGMSRRMGTDKARLPLGNQTMLERVVSILEPLFEQILVVTNRPETSQLLQRVAFVPDCMKTEVPNSLVGLLSALKASRHDWTFVVPCDTPLLNPDLIQEMKHSLTEVPVLVPYAEGYYQPLHSFYHKSCISSIEGMLKGKDYQVNHLYRHLPVQIFTEESILRLDPELYSFFNVNTLQDYEWVKKYIFST